MTETVHVAVYDTFADWEVGHAIAHINKPLWHKHPGRYAVATVGATREPVTTMGGIRILPDTTLDEVRPENSAMLVLAGNDIWNTEQFTPFAERARDFLEAGVPVAAICGPRAGSPSPAYSTIARTRATPPSSWRVWATRAGISTATNRPSPTGI